MRKHDARTLDHATLEALRERAVQRVQEGESPEVVARVLWIGRTAIYRWLADYRRGGGGALKSKPLFGRPPKLHGKKLQWVYNTVTQKNPLQLKFVFALWTREMVAKLTEHWKHLRTTNPIESTFATVRHRTIRSKGCFSNKTALAMVFKLIEGAKKTWRRLDGQNLLPKLIANVKFKDGIEASPPQTKAAA
jgi:transposase